MTATVNPRASWTRMFSIKITLVAPPLGHRVRSACRTGHQEPSATLGRSTAPNPSIAVIFSTWCDPTGVPLDCPRQRLLPGRPPGGAKPSLTTGTARAGRVHPPSS
ncbi:hypothetical protein FAIPA1_250059 [Frankia sp. AiPs1]